MRPIFFDAPDPARYVPRPCFETALAEVLDCVGEARPAAVVAPPGFGKTLLLRVVAARLGGSARNVYVPNPALSPIDLCMWTVAGLGGRAHWREPREAVAAFLSCLYPGGSPVLWLVDDADHLPEGTLHWMGGLIRQARGALRLVAASASDTDPLAALGPPRRVDALGQPMNLAETGEYVTRMLAGSATRSERPCGLDAIRSIHAKSAGVPRATTLAASDWFDAPPSRFGRAPRDPRAQPERPTHPLASGKRSEAHNPAGTGESSIFLRPAIPEPQRVRMFLRG